MILGHNNSNIRMNDCIFIDSLHFRERTNTSEPFKCSPWVDGEDLYSVLFFDLLLKLLIFVISCKFWLASNEV